MKHILRKMRESQQFEHMPQSDDQIDAEYIGMNWWRVGWKYGEGMYYSTFVIDGELFYGRMSVAQRLEPQAITIETTLSR